MNSVVIFSIILFLGLIASAAVGSEGQNLHKKFIKLGNLIGKTEAEIIKAVGLPSSRSLIPDGGNLLQWQATGYHIALLFNYKGICEGISHEYVSRN